MPKAAQFLPTASELDTERGVDVEVCQCSGCGLVQLSNEPVPYFREVLRAAGGSEDMKAFRRGQFGEFVARYHLQGKRVLEVGCGRGDFLSLLAEQDIKALGLEASEAAVEACRSIGLDAEVGFIGDSQTPLKQGPFDAFVFIQFLEHLPDPGAALHGISANLKDGGIGLVEVPNFDMILELDLFSEFIPDHLFYFTRESLETVLSLHGFEVIECREVWQRYILSATVRKRRNLDLSRFHARQAQLKADLQDYAGRFSRLAVWGAGHQALAVLSLADLAGSVSYVIDSAPFKQGRFTPATHIPIVPPDRLREDPVDAVVIMAASYSDEVAKILQGNFDPGIHIAILRDSGIQVVQ
jgi:2-polyprenyl-3-methyl-5-hydroxy-6-metoxy-1,4-benzoquinol methylase